MKLSFYFFLIVSILSLGGGCASPSRAYRDPLTYSFEQEGSPQPPQTEWHDLKGKIEETSQKIRSWEERYLW